MTRWAKITTQFEDFHAYPDAPDSVSFLRQKHRHMFHIAIWIEQFHDERDIEYISFKWWLDKLLWSHHNDTSLWPYTASCETIAHELGCRTQEHTKFKGFEGGIDRDAVEVWKRRKVQVEVTEDGENGALVEL